MPTVDEIRAELKNDPAGIGYKNPDGTFRSTREILHLLTHRPVVGTQPKTVPDPPSVDEVMGAVSPQSLAKIPDETLVRIREIVESGDLAAAARWLQVAQVKGYITQSEADAIAALLSRTRQVDEPVYGQPRILELGWGASISVDDVNRALGRPVEAY